MKKSKRNPSERVKSATYSLNLKKLERVLFYLLIFFLPTQLAYHFWPSYSFVFGVRVDYLSPAIYFTDFLAVLLIIVSRTRVKPYYLLTVGLLAFVNIVNSISPWVSFWKWLKIVELIFLGVFAAKNKNLFRTKKFFKVVNFSLALISIVGIAQFLLGRTLGGPFYFLGERSFDMSLPGIALENILGRDFLRPYSTFSHPNSLAGFLVVMLMAFPVLSKVLPGFVTLLTGSLSAFAGLLSALFLKKFSKALFLLVLLLSFAMPFIKTPLGEEVVSERIQLARVAMESVNKNFLLGTGLNTFVYSNSLLQPVHNIFLLVFSETGILGFMLFLIFLIKGFKKSLAVFVFVLITGFSDHYWLTLQQNMLLLALVYGYLF